MRRWWLGIFFGLGVTVVWASQTYVPPPPPALPKRLSKEKIRTGKDLFEENKVTLGPLEIHNYLGPHACSSCHDQKVKLEPKQLAKKFGMIREKINQEIVERSLGAPLPPQGPNMEGLVQYMIDRYQLLKRKLLK